MAGTSDGTQKPPQGEIYLNEEMFKELILRLSEDDDFRNLMVDDPKTALMEYKIVLPDGPLPDQPVLPSKEYFAAFHGLLRVRGAATAVYLGVVHSVPAGAAVPSFFGPSPVFGPAAATAGTGSGSAGAPPRGRMYS